METNQNENQQANEKLEQQQPTTTTDATKENNEEEEDEQITEDQISAQVLVQETNEMLEDLEDNELSDEEGLCVFQIRNNFFKIFDRSFQSNCYLFQTNLYHSSTHPIYTIHTSFNNFFLFYFILLFSINPKQTNTKHSTSID